MPNSYYQATSSTIIQAVSYVSALVLSVLDEHGAEYFDICDVESALLQKRLEEAIREGCLRLANDLDAL